MELASTSILLHRWSVGGAGLSYALYYDSRKAPMQFQVWEYSRGGGDQNAYRCGDLLKAIGWIERQMDDALVPIEHNSTVWCEQCDKRVETRKIETCTSKFCKVK